MTKHFACVAEAVAHYHRLGYRTVWVRNNPDLRQMQKRSRGWLLG